MQLVKIGALWRRDQADGSFSLVGKFGFNVRLMVQPNARKTKSSDPEDCRDVSSSESEP